MPARKSNPQKRSPNKKQRTSKANAALRSGAMTTQRESATRARGSGISEKQRSQGRYPGETPLTGEDRPATRPGGKKRIRAGDRAGKAKG